MAIRIRTVNGVTVALCAVESDEQEGDVYLDDDAHHALSTKFGLDFHSMGFMDNPHADPVIVEVMITQKVRDAEEELRKWLDEQTAITDSSDKTHTQITVPDSQADLYAADGWTVVEQSGGKTTLRRAIRR